MVHSRSSTIALLLAILGATPRFALAPGRARAAVQTAGAALATVSVSVGALGRTIPSDFDGFSIEVDDSARKYLGVAGSPNLVFYQLLKNLGAATIRIGGDSTDSSCWNPGQAPQPAGCRFTIAADAVEGYLRASAATGWGLIVGVNLAQNSPTWALQYGIEVAKAAQGTPRSRLLGFEFGNEPDLFSKETFFGHTSIRSQNYSWPDVVRDWKPYVSAFKGNGATATIPLAGPAFDDSTEVWRNSYLGPFIDGVGAKNLGFVTVHEYPTDTCGGNDVTIQQLLAPRLMKAYESRARGWVATARRRGLEVELGETHSTACSGKDGVDNAFAEAVWGLDWLFTNFNLGFRRINFHMDDAFYSAVFVTPTTKPDGRVSYANRVAPFYYAMYAFSAGAERQHIVPATISTQANLKAYAVRSSSVGPVTVFVINKDLTASGTVVIAPSARLGRGSLLVIQSPALNSNQATYGGVSFDNDTGRLSGTPRSTPVPADSFGNYSIALANATVAVLTLNP